MDKTLLKVSGIVSIVVGVICCITIVGAIVGIPMIIGGLKFKDYSLLSDSELLMHKDAIIIWTIVFMFINQISGVLSLIFILINNLFNTNNSNQNYTNMNYTNTNNMNYQNNDKYEQLEKLKKLYDEKALNKEEYEKEKDKILNGLN